MYEEKKNSLDNSTISQLDNLTTRVALLEKMVLSLISENNTLASSHLNYAKNVDKENLYIYNRNKQNDHLNRVRRTMF